MLSKYDDLLIHQVGRPLDIMATTDPRAFDRFYFSLHDRSGEFMLAFGAGVYPNLDVMDAGVAAVYDGKQINFRSSRALKGGDRADTVIGPISFEVLEGLKKWRMQLDENESGISFDLEYNARTEPVESPLLVTKQGHYTAYEQSHYTQAGRYSGSLTIGGREWKVEPETFFGQRDRSWGVRPVAEIARTGRPLDESIWGLHLWTPIQFQDRSIFIFYQEDQDGNPIHLAGAVHYENGNPSKQIIRVEHEIELDPISRIHKTSILHVFHEDGENYEIEARQLQPGIYLTGMGYGSHGVYRGDLSVESDVWDLDIPAEELASLGGGVDQLAEFKCGSEVAYGVYEHIISPKHAKYGTKKI